MSQFNPDISERDLPDPQVDGDLMEDEREDFTEESPLVLFDAEEWQTGESARRRWPWIERWLAMLAILCLISYVLTFSIRYLTASSLGFLIESQNLAGEPFIQEVRKAVVEINNHSVGLTQQNTRGTGFSIDAGGLILTNRHIVQGADVLAVKLQDQGIYYVTEWLEHPAADLALIPLKLENLPFLQIEQRLPFIGEKVYIIGNPLGFADIAVSGVVRAYGTVAGTDGSRILVMKIEAEIHPGSSGSPVVDQDGHVLAVIFAQIPAQSGTPTHGLAIPIEEAALLLE